MIDIVEIDLAKEPFSPSIAALNKTKEMASTNKIAPTLSYDNTEESYNLIYTYVVDIWIGFKSIEESIEISTSEQAISQQAQENLKKAQEQFAKGIEVKVGG